VVEGHDQGAPIRTKNAVQPADDEYGVKFFVLNASDFYGIIHLYGVYTARSPALEGTGEQNA
jgi:hypothetical protein